MDKFLSDLNVLFFKEWIKNQKTNYYQLSYDEKEDTLILETKYCVGKIIFNPLRIIEMSIYNKTISDYDFYLHFQLKTLSHAIELFHEMQESMKNYINEPKINILLCCSSGITTSYFANKLNDAASILSLNYLFNAVSYSQLSHCINDYDIVLLAPQISYQFSQVKKLCNKQYVFKIPSSVFGKYDVKTLLSMIDNLNKTNEQHKNLSANTIKKMKHDEILVIAYHRKLKYFSLDYCIYDQNNQVIQSKEIKKNSISLNDLVDILDTVLTIHLNIKTIQIIMPGIIHQGKLYFPKEGFINKEIIHELSHKYHRQFQLSNDVDCIVTGYYYSQDKYKTISYIFLPNPGHAGGIGTIYNGQLLNGRKNISGLPVFYNQSEDYKKCLIQSISYIMSIVNPEAIIISNNDLFSINELVIELEKNIPRKYIPYIHSTNSLKEYMLLGGMLLSILDRSEEDE